MLTCIQLNYIRSMLLDVSEEMSRPAVPLEWLWLASFPRHSSEAIASFRAYQARLFGAEHRGAMEIARGLSGLVSPSELQARVDAARHVQPELVQVSDAPASLSV